MKYTLPLFGVVVATLASSAHADVLLPVQGFLTDSGVAVVDDQDLEFRLLAEDATPITCEIINVSFENGFFDVVLGDDGAACDSDEPTVLPADIFQQRLSLEVSREGTALGLFPVGDVPSAGFAQLAGGLIGLHPRTFLVADVGELQRAITTAGELGEPPVVIELGPDTYDVGTLLIPPNAHLRGQGATSTTIIGQVTLAQNTRLTGLRVTNNANNGNAIVVDIGPNDVVELMDVAVRNDVNVAEGVSVGVFIGGGADISSRVVLRDCDLRVTAGNLAFGLLDGRGVTLEVRDTAITANTGPGAAIALRLGQRAPEGDPTPNHNLRILNSSLEANMTGGFASAIDIIATGGTTRIVGSDLRAGGPGETRGITNIASDVRVNGSQFFANHPFYSEDAEIRCAHCGIQSFLDEIVDPTSLAPVRCLSSYDEGTFTALGSTCQPL